MINMQSIDFFRKIVCDAIYGTSYTSLSDEYDLLIVNLLCVFIIVFATFIFVKALFFVLRLFGG